jgi:transposase
MSKDEIIAQQAQQIAELQTSLQAALRKIAELEARLGQNSRNSSRPPASDGLKKKPAFPRSSGKLRGGQKGHRGNTLDMVVQADQVILHPVIDVCSCGGDLSEVEGRVSAKRQVFDLPPQALVVTEHQSERKVCNSCGQVHQGAFPSDVLAPVQYGDRVKALVSLLSVGHNMPVGGIKGLFTDLFGYALNEATIQGANTLYYEELAEEEAIVKDKLQQEKLIHADESGVRTEGKLHWLHVASSLLFTYFYRHSKRGREALEDQKSVLSAFSGWVVHDCWASYFTGGDYRHALCGAHLLRELVALIEQGSQWAIQMHELLMATYLACEKGKSSLAAVAQQTTIRKYQTILQQADREEPPPEPRTRGRDKQTKGRNLMNRLAKHQAAVLAFAQYEEVPFTNNLAERDGAAPRIRPWKTKLKVSGCFRTTTGADHYARIRGFISTARKQQKQVFAELCRVLNGESFLRDIIST